MSTQLILYPQYYDGFNSTATPVFNEYIVNGINFIGFNSTDLHNTTSVHPSQDTIDTQPPSVLGNWYRFTTTGGDYGAVTAPTYAAGAVQLSHNAVTAGQTGIYQQLSGLAIGAMYEVKISVVTPQAEILTFEMWSGNVNVHQAPLSANTSTITATFTAQTTNDVFLIYYEGIAANLSINKISISESPINPSLIYSELEDGQVICDLYEEEDIPLTLSIDEFTNVAEQVKSYSKDFNLPATKRNNRIFNNMFEITRADDNGIIFNPYVKTQCVLKQDGFNLFEGYLRMIDIKDKEGEISYNVNLYSEVIALADILKDKTLADLNFSELDHEYNIDTIKDSWETTAPGAGLPLITPLPVHSFAYDAVTGTGHTQVLKYPFIDWTHQYLVGGTGSGTIATAGNPELTDLQQAFRPCIQLKYLINKIFAATDFNYKSAFFDGTVFAGLFMDFNWGAGNAPVVFDSSGGGVRYISSQTIAPAATWVTLTTTSDTYPAELGYSAGVFTAQNDGQVYFVSYDVEFEWGLPLTATLDVEWIITSGSTITPINPVVGQLPSGISFTYSSSFTTPPLAAGDTLQCRAKGTSATIQFAAVGSVANTPPNQFTVNSSVDQITNDALLDTLRGELGQYDFLKGIMTMFNLVTLADKDNPNNILIEPYSDIFINNTVSGNTGNLTLAARSIQHDWTEKIDVSQIDLTPLTDLNKRTVFQFVEDDDDYAFKIYKDSTHGRLYGSYVYDASGFTILEGTKRIIAEPFAATVSKPLDAQFAQFVTPAVYSMNDDGTSEGFDNSPRILYNNGEKSTGASYYTPEQNGGSEANQTNFLQFSHLSAIPNTGAAVDFTFSSEHLSELGLGATPILNLYRTYWQPYFNELYNADTRTMKLKVNLTPSDISTFEMYDTVMIKNRSFRVNKIEYKPNSLSTVEFILIP